MPYLKILKPLGLLIFALPLSSVAQYCTTAGPTSTIDSNVQSVALVGNSSNINHTGCSGVLGTEDLTAQLADVTAGNTYTLSVQFGTCGNNYAGAGEVWIDWNSNGTFDTGESIGTWAGTPPVSLSVFNFTVPANACNDTTRMRVIQAEQGTNPLDPCAAFTWGSVMDFGISVSGGDSCNGSSYCAGGPTSAADSNIETVVLNGVSSSINFAGCPGVIGVQNSGEFADLYASASYSMTIEFGTCGGNYAGAGEAWIDFDSSGTFDTNESIGTWAGTPPVAAQVFSFQVPVGSIIGFTTMRINHQEGGVLPLDPCAAYTWGSCTDFDIEILGGVNCDFPLLGDNTSDPIMVPSLPYVDTGTTAMCFSNQSMAYNSPDVFYEFTAPSNVVSVDIVLCSSSFDTYLLVLDEQGGTYAYNDDHSNCPSAQSAIYQMPVDPDSTYQVIVQGWDYFSGDYILEILAAGIVGIDNQSIDQFSIAPNLTTGITYLKNDSYNTDLQLKVVDLGGKLVYEWDGHLDRNENHELNLSHLSPGNYWISVQTEQQIEHHQLIIH